MEKGAAAYGSGPPEPRPPLTTPASYYEPVGPFFFYVETLTARDQQIWLSPTQPCIQSGVFKRGMRMVVRFEILDTSTGKRVTDKDGATVKLRLAAWRRDPRRDGRFAAAAAAMPDSAWMWDTSWDIPPDYPVGSLDYRIVIAAKDGRTATFISADPESHDADTRVRI